MQRYFARVENQQVILNSDDIFHLTRVMRVRVDDKIEVVAKQKLYLALVKSLDPLKIEIINELTSKCELLNKITLYYVMAKGDKTDLVVQKATELGVHKIILLQSRRSVVQIDSRKVSSKLERYNKIAKEASEQAKRLIVPKIEMALDFQTITLADEDIKLIADEDQVGGTTLLYKQLDEIKDQSIGLLVGPEGGFEREEVALAQDHGFKVLGLGSRILRSETAAIVFVGTVSSYLERL